MNDLFWGLTFVYGEHYLLFYSEDVESCGSLLLVVATNDTEIRFLAKIGFLHDIRHQAAPCAMEHSRDPWLSARQRTLKAGIWAAPLGDKQMVYLS